MAEDEMPTLAQWLAEYRSRPEPIEAVLYRVTFATPVPSAVPGRSDVASLRISRFDAPRDPAPIGGFYVLHEDAAGGWVTDTIGCRPEDARR